MQTQSIIVQENIAKEKTREIIAEIEQENLNTAEELLKLALNGKDKGKILKSIFTAKRYKENKEKNNYVLRVIKLLKATGVDFNLMIAGETYLTLAIAHGFSNKVLGKLIEAGANINQANEDGETPLSKVDVETNGETFIFLLNHRARIKKALEQILLSNHGNSIKKFNKTMEFLRNEGFAPNFNGDKARLNALLKATVLLRWVEKKEKKETFELLLAMGATLYEGIASHAIQSNQGTFLKYLIKKYRINLPKDIPHFTRPGAYDLDDTILSTESSISLAMFRFCLSKNMSLANYSLAETVVLKTPDAVRYFIKQNEVLNLKLQSKNILSSLNDSPTINFDLAHFAAAVAHPISLSLLIRAGLNIRVTDSFHRTPLHYAGAYGSEKNARLLLFYRAFVDACDYNSQTPLHYTARYRKSEFSNRPCALLLLSAGADSSRRDSQGNTPLDLVKNKHLDRKDKSRWEEVLNAQPKEVKNAIDHLKVHKTKTYYRNEIAAHLTENNTIPEIESVFEILVEQQENNKDLNHHRHSNFDKLFHLKNTNTWQVVARCLRQEAEKELYDIVKQDKIPEKQKLSILRTAKDKKIFSLHLGNSWLPLTWRGETKTVQRINKEIERIETSLKNK